jgi:hypothetical protein
MMNALGKSNTKGRKTNLEMMAAIHGRDHKILNISRDRGTEERDVART